MGICENCELKNTLDCYVLVFNGVPTCNGLSQGKLCITNKFEKSEKTPIYDYMVGNYRAEDFDVKEYVSRYDSTIENLKNTLP